MNDKEKDQPEFLDIQQSLMDLVKENGHKKENLNSVVSSPMALSYRYMPMFPMLPSSNFTFPPITIQPEATKNIAIEEDLVSIKIIGFLFL